MVMNSWGWIEVEVECGGKGVRGGYVIILLALFVVGNAEISSFPSLSFVVISVISRGMYTSARI